MFLFDTKVYVEIYNVSEPKHTNIEETQQTYKSNTKLYKDRVWIDLPSPDAVRIGLHLPGLAHVLVLAPVSLLMVSATIVDISTT